MDKAVAEQLMLHNAVIPPPFTDGQRQPDLRTVRVVIDSRHRDPVKYPNPAKYELDLEEDLLQVTTAELLTANVPLTAHVISKKMCTLTVATVGSSRTDVSVQPGDYTAETMASALETSLATALPTQSWTVYYDHIADRIRIGSNDAFVIICGDASAPAVTGGYKVGSMGRAIGLDRIDNASRETAPGQHVLVAPFRPDLEQHLYAVLHIKHVCLNKSFEPLLNKSFAVLTGRAAASTYNYSSTSNRIKKCINPPVARISRVCITFKDRSGDLYDFQNRDHVLEVAFEVAKHVQRYNA